MRSGDKATEAVVHRALDHGAHAAASLVALLDPEIVVLTGLIAEYPDLADHLITRIETLLPSRRQLAVRTSSLGVRAWVRGAILVALQQLHPEVGGALSGAGTAQSIGQGSASNHTSPEPPDGVALASASRSFRAARP
jgi:hypothetical protein